MYLSSSDLYLMIGIIGALAGAYRFFKGRGDDDDHNHGAGAVGALASLSIVNQ